MDFEINRQASCRSNALTPELLDGPLWRENEFDLKDSFWVLDDFYIWEHSRTGAEWSRWLNPRKGGNEARSVGVSQGNAPTGNRYNGSASFARLLQNPGPFSISSVH